jgi:hypothetical protein
MSEGKVEYLGDSVYGDYSTGDLRLYTDNGEGASNEIILNGDVLTSLFKFVERSLVVKITVKPDAQKTGERR